MSDRNDPEVAKALIACLDITNLNDDCTEADVDALCERAETPQGKVAAICIWPRFVAHARQRVPQGVKIATVVNFPAGGDNVEAAFAEAAEAFTDDADEIDLVVAWRRVKSDPGFVEAQVRRMKLAAGGLKLKAILETGELGDPDLIRRAADEALAGGADFLKTSTGKTKVSATPESARILLTAIREHGGAAGFKPAGGIKTFEDAKAYRDLAEEICGPGWAIPERFRIGASSVLADLLAVAGGQARTAEKGGY